MNKKSGFRERIELNPKDNSLAIFVNEIMDHYQEPTRTGIPKGEPIGFSKQKMGCCLLMLSHMTLKQISKFTGVSYGLLKKWRTEDEFKRRHEGFAREFVARIQHDLHEIAHLKGPDLVDRFERIFKGIGNCHDALFEDIMRDEAFTPALLNYVEETGFRDLVTIDRDKVQREVNKQMAEKGYCDIPGIRIVERKYGRFR